MTSLAMNIDEIMDTVLPLMIRTSVARCLYAVEFITLSPHGIAACAAYLCNRRLATCHQ